MNPNDPISAAFDALHNQNLLAAENARLKAEVAALRKELADAQESYHIVNKHLSNNREQVERLTKAGDAMKTWLSIVGRRTTCGEIEEWLRAKNGLPSLNEQYEKQKALGWDFVRPHVPKDQNEDKQP
jgi:chromosome segregation ATPase